MTASSNVVLFWYMLEVTACALYIVKREANRIYKNPVKDKNDISEEKCENSSESYPVLKFWNLILKLEPLLPKFVKSLQSRNFQYYVETLKQITPWIFSLNDLIMPVHLTQMIDLKEMHQPLNEKFNSGKFIVHKRNGKFSKIALDQKYEQLNAGIKGVGGAIGLSKDDNALQRWLTTRLEVSRLLEEFEAFHAVDSEVVLEHHDSSASVAKQFLSDVKMFLGAMDDIFNHFLGQNVTAFLKQVGDTGKKQLLECAETRLHETTCPITNTIFKSNLKFFRTIKSRSSSKKQEKRNIAKKNVALFSRMYISCQTREGDLKNFFSHENQGLLPSLLK